MQTQLIGTSYGRIAYRMSAGTGPTLMLVHSNSSSGGIFVPQFSAFGERLRLIALDLPGHGESDDLADPSGYGLMNFAACVGEVLDRLDIDTPLVAGFSLGGHVALEMTRMRRLAGVAIVGSPPFAKDPARIGEAFPPDPVGALSFVGELDATQVAAFADGLSDGRGHEPPWRELVRRTDPAMRAALGASLFAPEAGDQRLLAETCPVPLAVINGANDRFIDLDYIDSLAYANLWSGRTHRIAGASHAPFHSRPDAFNALLGQLIDSVF